MVQLSLNPDSALPLVEQIVEGIRARIDDRLLRPGMRLPPIRSFAEQHQVSRFTVVEAYDRLVAQGYVRSRRGSGFYVEARRVAENPLPAPGSYVRAMDAAGMLHSYLSDDPSRLWVGVGWLPPEWLDVEGIRRHLRALSRREDVKLTAYGSPQGYTPLREQISLKLAEVGVQAAPAQIILGQGATQGFDIVTRYFLKPGDCVLVDDPGYWNLFANLRLYGLNLVGVPWTPQGPDIAALENLLQVHQPKMFITQSVLQNPTSHNLSPATAFRILQLAEKHNFWIVEDDIYCDLHPGGATRMATLDQLKRVIYVGSFSKTLSSNLRVGFVACEPSLAADLTDVKMVSCVSSSEFAEQLVHAMLAEGHYRKYIERVRGRLAECTDRALRMLERCNFEVLNEPVGGLFVWARAPGMQDAARLASQAAEEGIMLAPGHIFRPQTEPSPWLRFNVAYTQDPRLETFLKKSLDKVGA